MNIILIAVSTVIIIAAIAGIWWYYPFVRKPWGPSYIVEQRIKKICEDAQKPYPLEAPHVVISKAKRNLMLYDGDKLLKTYKAALGTNPVDDKQRNGDDCTPEGDFYICTRNEQSRYHLFLGISYPNAEDAERGPCAGMGLQRFSSLRFRQVV